MTVSKCLGVCALALLFGCQKPSPLEHARDRYLMMLANHAPASDLCAEAKKNAKTALDAMDEAEYRFWLKAKEQACSLPDDPEAYAR